MKFDQKTMGCLLMMPAILGVAWYAIELYIQIWGAFIAKGPYDTLFFIIIHLLGIGMFLVSSADMFE